MRQGEHLAKIAARYSLDPARIWDHPDNEGLRKKRRSPAVLLAGDALFVPDLGPDDEKIEDCGTEQLHTFSVTLPTIEIEIHLRLPDGTALANEPYRLTIERPLPEGDLEIEGATDGDGYLRERLPVETRMARLALTRRKITLPLGVGDLDPHRCEESGEPIVSGLQARLTNLGFGCGPVDGVLGPRTRRALRAFQRRVLGRTDPTGEPDEETCARLAEDHLS